MEGGDLGVPEDRARRRLRATPGPALLAGREAALRSAGRRQGGALGTVGREVERVVERRHPYRPAALPESAPSPTVTPTHPHGRWGKSPGCFDAVAARPTMGTATAN